MIDIKDKFEFNFPFATKVKGRMHDDEPMTYKQGRYIQTICDYLDMEFPDITTKEEACKWLEENVPRFHAELAYDEAHILPLYENYGDR